MAAEGQVQLGANGPIYTARSVEDILSGLDAQARINLEALDVPMHVKATDEEDLKQKVNQAIGGRFHVSLYTVKKKKNSFIKLLQCSCNKDPSKGGHGTNCQWWVGYELMRDGWVCERASPAAKGEPCGPYGESHSKDFGWHNHPLFGSVAESQSSATGHYVPDNLDVFAKLMAKSGETTATILRNLTTAWRQEHGTGPVPPMPWNYEFLRYKYFSCTGEKLDLDFKGLMDMLEQRRDNEGLERFVDYDRTSNRMNRLYVELPGAKAEWAVGGKHNVMLIDPTFGTNVYRFKLCLITSVSSSGHTVILAYVLIDVEGINDFDWIFRCHHKVFRTPPSVVFSDHDLNIEAAMQRMQDSLWPDVCHMLCIFHLSKNVYERLHPKFLGDKKNEKWRAVHDLFWKISKNTDASFRDFFDAQWKQLVDLVEQTATHRGKLQEEITWLTKLGAQKARFAYCYTHEVCTLGVYSTQRAEAMQNVAKKGKIGLNNRTKLLTLHEKIDEYNADARARHDVDVFRTMFKQSAFWVAPVLEEMRGRICVFAFGYLLSQAQEAYMYKSPPKTIAKAGKYSFEVTRQAIRSSEGLRYEDNGKVQSYDDLSDFGLAGVYSGSRTVEIRVTGEPSDMTLLEGSCSCQMGNSWGFGLCRHLFHILYTHQIMHVNVDYFVIPKWHKHDQAALHQMTDRLIRQPRVLHYVGTSEDERGDAGPSSSATPMRMDRHQRRSLLGHVAHELLDLGAVSDEKYEKLLAALKDLRLIMSEPTPQTQAKKRKQSKSGPSAMPSAEPDNAGGVASARRHSAQIGPMGGLDPTVQTLKPSVWERTLEDTIPHFKALTPACRQQIQAKLRNDYDIDLYNPFRNVDEVLGFKGAEQFRMQGRFILYKWGKSPTGTQHRHKKEDTGWHVGRVIRALGDATKEELVRGVKLHKNFLVSYGEGDVHEQVLDKSNCCNYQKQPTPPSWSWFLLVARELHCEALTDQVLPPPAVAKKGRPDASKRRKPAAGPTST